MKVEKVFVNGKYYKKWFYLKADGKTPTVCVDEFLYSFIEDSDAFKLFTYLGHISYCSKNKTISEFTFKDINKNIKINKEKILKSLKYLSELQILKIISINNEKVTCELYTLIESDNSNTEYEETAYDLFGSAIEEDITVILETNVKTNKKENKTQSRNDNGYNKWKKDVLKRDNYTCQLCGCINEDTILNVHHIERYSDNEELRTDINNGITLCYKCHQMVFGKEKEYEEYFKAIINNKN